MIFQSPASLSLAFAISAGQFMMQLPSQADLLASLSLSHVYRVMPLASVKMPFVTLTLAGMPWATAKPPTAAATMNAGAMTRIDFMGVSSKCVVSLVVDAGGWRPTWTNKDVNIGSRFEAMASGGAILRLFQGLFPNRRRVIRWTWYSPGGFRQ